MTRSTNPFEALDLEPTLDLRGLTEALRERAESSPPAERARIQGIWQSLTMDPKQRAEAALLARPRGPELAPLDRLLALRLPIQSGEPIDGLALARTVDPLDLALPPPYTSAPRPSVGWIPPKLTEDPALSVEPED